jgi:hypothetical protein
VTKVAYGTLGVGFAFNEDLALFGCFLVGMSIGGAIELGVHLWGIAKVHEAFAEVIDWTKLDQLCTEYEFERRT